MCTDLDTRHISPAGLANLHVVRHDITRDALPEGQFDLAHARLVLLHIPERAAVLERMLTALKPGGWLVIEDFDTTSVLPDLSVNPCEAWLRTADAMRQYMIRGGVDARFGRSLYGRFKRLGLTDVYSEGRVTMWDGFNGGVELLRINYEQVGQKLVAAGLLDADQLRADQARLDDPDFVMPSPTMWVAAGRKPSAPQSR